MQRNRGFEPVILQKKNTTISTPPKRADVGSCAYDFYTPYGFILEPNEQKLIWTDIKAYMQKDEVLILNVRSSQGKLRLQLANTAGWIDSSYYNNQDNEGNIGIFLRNEDTESHTFGDGEKFCQGMFTKFLITDDDEPISAMRIGGFGSTGIK